MHRDQPPALENGYLNGAAKAMIASIIFDAALSITALVIGILGLLAIIPNVPCGVSISCLILSGLVTMIWVAMAGVTQGKALHNAKKLLLAPFVDHSHKPNRYY